MGAGILSGATAAARSVPGMKMPSTIGGTIGSFLAPGVGTIVGAGLGSIIEGAFSLYAQGKAEKQAEEQNRVMGQQYKEEKSYNRDLQKWQQDFMKDQDQWNRHQTNLSNIRQWGKDIEGLVNSNQELKNGLVNIWNKSRSF